MSIETSLRAERQKNTRSATCRDMEFIFRSQRLAGKGPTKLSIQRSPVITRRWRESDHSHPLAPRLKGVEFFRHSLLRLSGLHVDNLP